MSLFSKKNKTEPGYAYDPEREKPVIRASVCTGERAAGFKDLKTGKFREVILIREKKELEAFMREYGLEHIDTEY
jgi:hypothetical protein